METKKIFTTEQIESKCKHCDWVGIPTKTQVGEFVTYICPNNHVVSFEKTVVEKQKSIKKNDIKKAAVKNIITKMDFIVGRNKDMPVIELNKIYNENNLLTFSRIEDNFIDLIVTSPPYDNLREYEKNVEWDYQKVMIETLRT